METTESAGAVALGVALIVGGAAMLYVLPGIGGWPGYALAFIGVVSILAGIIGALLAREARNLEREAQQSKPGPRPPQPVPVQYGQPTTVVIPYPQPVPVTVNVNQAAAQPPPPQIMRRCRYCNTVYPESALKCPSCGAAF